VDARAVQVPQAAGFEEPQRGNGYTANNLLKFGNAIEVAQPGYLYVWVSNESEDTEVWFDDLNVVHQTTIVSQATDYETWGGVLRDQKWEDLEGKYRYGYQGQYSEKDEETGWGHFELREYDPVIGRWMVTDSHKQYPSPYTGMGNNPNNLVDPRGGCTDANGKSIPCPGGIPEKGNEDLIVLDEVLIKDYRYFGGGIFDRVTDIWKRDGKNYSTVDNINIQFRNKYLNTSYTGEGVGLSVVLAGGFNFSLDKVKTKENGQVFQDTYFTASVAMGFDISGNVHGTEFSNSDGRPITSSDIEGFQWSWSSGYGPLSYQRSGSIIMDGYFPTWGPTTSNQVSLGIGPSIMSPVNGSVGLGATVNISMSWRQFKSYFK
jgi:RHS repeat-associated protein